LFLCFNLVYIDCTELKPKVRWFVLVVCFVGRRRCRRVVKQDRFQTDKKKHTTTETVLVLSLLKKHISRLCKCKLSINTHIKCYIGKEVAGKVVEKPPQIVLFAFQLNTHISPQVVRLDLTDDCSGSETRILGASGNQKKRKWASSHSQKDKIKRELNTYIFTCVFFLHLLVCFSQTSFFLFDRPWSKWFIPEYNQWWKVWAYMRCILGEFFDVATKTPINRYLWLLERGHVQPIQVLLQVHSKGGKVQERKNKNSSRTLLQQPSCRNAARQ